SAAPADWPAARWRSQAVASASQSGTLAPAASAAILPSSRVRQPGGAISVATRDMEPAGLIDDAILIAGPTASGKSALALDLARRHGGVVVNADSMQVYGVLEVLTARPGPKETEAVPH